MDETSPAVTLRAKVVLLVVASLVAFGFISQIEIGILLVIGRSIPAELWVAGATPVASLTALLVNTKHEATAADPAPVQVVNQPGDPVPVDAAPGPDDEAPTEDDVQPEDPEPAAPKSRRR